MGSGILIRPGSALHQPGGDGTSLSFTADTLSQRTKPARANHLEVPRQRFVTESLNPEIHLTNIYINNSGNMRVSEYDCLPPSDDANDDALVVSLVLADGTDREPLRLET